MRKFQAAIAPAGGRKGRSSLNQENQSRESRLYPHPMDHIFSDTPPSQKMTHPKPVLDPSVRGEHNIPRSKGGKGNNWGY